MSLYPTGVVYSRASQEHGKRAVAAALHPRGKSVFLVSGQVIDEIDTSDGSLIYRIISDLSAPIVRLEVCTGARGYEYLLLLSAANELRVWDIERRFHFSSIKLGGGGGQQGDGGGSANPPAGPGISLLAPSQFHDRCILFYARAGSWQVEALHLQRQLEIPGSPALLTVVEPKSFSGKSPVSALAVHPHLPLLASATVEGVVSVHWCPFLGAPLEGGNNNNTTSSSSNNATLLFAATLNPEVSLGQGGRVKRPPSSASIGSVGAAAMGHLDLADAVLTLAWHPYLPLLLAVDACGRVCVWRVGDFGGGAAAAAPSTQPAAHHSLLASRAYAIPSTTPDEFPRIATSAAFHATLPYVWIASHAPSTPSLPPHIAAWSYAHATLPALPSPVSPSLAALMIAAAGDAVTAASAHLWMPPALLCVGGGRAGACIWVGGRVIVSAFVAGCVGGVGVREDDESFGPLGRALMGGAVEEGGGGNSSASSTPARPRASNAYTAQALWPTEPSPGTTAPTVPYGAGGIVAGGAVGEVIHAPRRWFIAGGEGEGWDLSGAASSAVDGGMQENSSSSKEEEEKEEEELEEERRKKDLFGGGLSLADFARSLAEGGDEGVGTAGAGATPQGTTTTSTTSAAKCIPAQRAGAAGVYYATPPAQGEHCDALVYVDSVWEVPTAPNPRWTVAHYLAVRQLGFPAAGAGDVGAADGDSTTNTPSAARRIAALPSLGPGGPIYPTSVRRSPNSRFYAVFFAYASAMSGEFLETLGGVGPGDVEGAAAAAASPATAALGGGGGGAATGSSNGTLVCIVGPLCLEGEGGNSFLTNPPVSPLTPVQDLAFLSGDRALVLHPHSKRGGGGAATTAATILPLEPTTTAFAGLRRGGEGSNSEDALRFALPYTILRAFPTPFECPKGKHEEDGSEEAHCQDVLLYVSKWNPTDDTDYGDGERAVLRYSNAAFGRYAQGNPHAYAIVDAQTFAEVAVAASPPPPPASKNHLRRKVSIEEEQAGVPQLTASVPIGSGPLPARQQGALPYCANGMEAGEAYEAHVAASMRCPPLIRPILVLSPREVVLSVAWSGAEGVWGDKGEGFEGVEGTATNKGGGGPPLTLPAAIASGSPLLAILTSHRLCIASPALKLLCAIPTFVPMGGPAEFGVRHVNGGPWGNSSGGVASSFGVWRSDYFSVATPALLEDDEEGAPETLSITLDGGYNAEVKGDTGEGQSEDPFSALASLVVASPYDASSGKVSTGLTLPSASQRFPATAERSSPQDSSASFSGGIMQSTVASASAAGVKLTCPLPASRSSDTIPQDDMVEDGGGNGGSPGWTAPITGYLWQGSALLFSVGGGELMYLTARGNVGGVCTLESGVGTARRGDAIPLCVHHDRIAYICRHPVTGKSLVRLRSFSPLEPLVVSLIDHASTRPKPSFSLLGAAVPGPSGSDTPPHPVVAALSHTLSSSILVVNANSKTPSSSSSLHGVKGQAAVSALAIAALARDYAAVRDAVTRYCSPTPKLDPSPLSPSSTLVDTPYLTHGESPPLSVGVSRPLVDSLLSVGFLNMAFFVMGGGSQGLRVSGESALQAEAGVGGEEEEEEGGSSKVGGSSNLDVYRQRANYALFPPAARSALALARGSWSQALWILCSSSDPALGEAVLKLTGFSPLTGDEAGEENGGVVEGMKLPHPTSSLAASLRSLSKAAMGGGATRVAVLAADIAGDHALALEALIVGGFASQERLKGVRRHRQWKEGEEEEEEEEGNRRASQMKGGPTGVKWGGYGWMPPCDIHAGLSGLVSLNKDRNYPLAAASALIRRHLLILAAAEGGNGGTDPTAPSRALDGIRGGAVFPPLAATGRSQRSSESGLLPTNYGLLPTPSQHRLAHSTSTSPFSPLFNDTLLSALASSSSSKRGGVRDPPHALLFKGVGVSGSVAFGPSTPPPPFPPLPTLLDPLPCDTLARWLGVTAPGRPYFRIRRSRAAAAEETDGQQGGDGGSGGMTMEELLGNGGGGGEGGDASASNPVEFAYACSRGKKRLKALPRGAEDAVVGYWRFHKGGEEEAAPAGARKSWMETPGNGNGVGERVEAWFGMGGAVDLSRMASMGQLFDALALASNPPSSPTNPRLGFGHRFDAPCDPGDPKKVKDPRVLVFGCGTKHQQQQQQQQALPTSLPAHPHLALLLPLAVHYAAAIPLPRYTYTDVGLRPWDSANAVFTFEAWVRVGSQHPAAAVAGGGGGDEEDDEDGGRGGGSSSGGNSTPKAGAVVNATSFTLAMRTERVRGAGATASSKISARVQWSLKVTPDGALAFESGKDGEEEEEDPPSLPHATLSSSPGLIPPCEWRHVAVCVDGSGGAREAMAVARGGGGGGKGGGSSSNNKAATSPSYPPATVRLYVGGVMCGEGKVPCGPPLPILEEEEGPGGGGEEEGGVPPSSPPTLMPTHPGRATSDHLLLGPNLVGRMCETRVWACKRSGEELNDAKDFHLDLAEIKRMGGKGAMSIAIKPHHVAAPAAAASVVPLKKLGGASTVPTTSTIAPPPLSPPSTATATTTPPAAGLASSATATIPPPKDDVGGGGGGLRRFGLAPPTAPPATATTSEAMRRRLGGGGSGGAPASFDPFAKPSPAPSSSPSEVVVVEEEVEKKQYPPPSDAGALPSVAPDGTAAAAAAAGTSAPEAPPIKLGGGGLGVGGLGGLGGLGAPPPGVTTGGKRAEMMRKKLQMQQPQ